MIPKEYRVRLNEIELSEIVESLRFAVESGYGNAERLEVLLTRLTNPQPGGRMRLPAMPTPGTLITMPETTSSSELHARAIPHIASKIHGEENHYRRMPVRPLFGKAQRTLMPDIVEFGRRQLGGESRPLKAIHEVVAINGRKMNEKMRAYKETLGRRTPILVVWFVIPSIEGASVRIIHEAQLSENLAFSLRR